MLNLSEEEVKKMGTLGCLDNAILIATIAHKGQFDRAGAPYILHPLRVMMNMTTLDGKIVAVLHDVIEDTDVSLEDLEERNFSSEIIYAIDCITKRNNEIYDDYLNRVITSPLASECKLKDMKDNSNIFRLNHVEGKHLKMIQKYHKGALYILKHRPEFEKFFFLTNN